MRKSFFISAFVFVLAISMAPVSAQNLADGSKAVGLFNRANKAVDVEVNWDELKISGKNVVRDLWHQKNLGVFRHTHRAQIPAQGVVMVKSSRN